MQLNQKLINNGKFLFKYRGQIPLILFLISIPIIYQTSYYNIYTTNLKPVFQSIALVISLIGLLLRYYTIGTTPNETSGRNRNTQVAKHLNITGAYSVVRNPLYLANYMLWLGLSLFSLSYLFIIITTLLFIIHYERIILVEEKFLLKKFKSKYELFCHTTPVLLPSFKNFKKSKCKFSIKKILRQEYSSTLTVIISFLYLDLITQITYSQKIAESISIHDLKSYIFILVISLYITICLKIFKNYTHLLDD